MKKAYRLNVRFDLSDAAQKELAEKLRTLDHVQHSSINSFILEAIRDRFENAEQTQTLAETLRKVLREELRGMTFEATPQINTPESSDDPDEVASVLDTLAMFE